MMIIITGPTGVGKSDMALALAKEINGEIVNADVGQFYLPLTIGIAKPNWQGQQIPHHLFDVVPQPVNYSVMDFLEQVRVCVQAIHERGHVPIIVGGSSFYIYSLFFPPVHDSVRTSNTSKRSYDQPIDQLSTDQLSTEQLWSALQKIDAVRAAQINVSDRYRIMRALNIWHTHQLKPSTLKPVFAPLQVPAALIVITRDRQDLVERINERVHLMFDAGWIEEVEKLGYEWHEFLLNKKLIGYDDIVRWLEKRDQQKQLVAMQLNESIAQKTRAYAKRQTTFNRLIVKKVEEHRDCVYTELINVTGKHYDEILQKLSIVLKEKGYGRE